MIFYSHDTALAFWRRQALLGGACNLTPCARGPHKSDFEPWDEITASCPVPLNDADTVHVTAGCRCPRVSLDNVQYHHSAVPLPKSAYLSIRQRRGKGVAADSKASAAVASPELTFIQKASDLSFLEAVHLGYAMCSSFLPVEPEIDMRGFCSIRPLCTIASIMALTAKAANMRGVKTARRAAKYIADGAASPRELVLAMMLSMPMKEGGYGLPLPELNAELSLTAAQKRTIGKSFVRVDMLWRDRKVAVEYDSDQWHTGTERIAADSKRRNLLKAMGFEVITITNSEIKNLRSLDVAIAGLMRALKLRKFLRVDNYEAKKRKLHSWLMSH